MYKNKFISAVIVAAGASSRMKKGISKQLIPLLGKPALSYTVSAFLSCKITDEIIIVCPVNNMDSFKSGFDVKNSKIPIKFVEGGMSRQESVFRGVSVTDSRSEFIAVHDGARPLIEPEMIKKVVEDAIVYSAATLAVPVKDTVKLVENNVISSTPERNKLRAIQTPQVFDKQLYLSAYNAAAENSLYFTDDCQLIEYYGKKVYVTQGDYTNIKLTTPEDIAVAEVYLKLRGENK